MEIVTDVRFTAYDNGDGDMISFYMTADSDKDGKWEYSADEGEDVFKVFFESEELKDYGTFGMEGTASYKTLVLKPISEGEAEVKFSLTEKDSEKRFSVKVEKDDSGSFRIKAEEIQ